MDLYILNFVLSCHRISQTYFEINLTNANNECSLESWTHVILLGYLSLGVLLIRVLE